MKVVYKSVFVAGTKYGVKKFYSRTSRKQPPKMSSLGGRLQEVVAYNSLDHSGSNFCLISILWHQRLTPSFKHFIHVKKIWFPIEILPSLILPRNTITLQYLIIQFPLYYLWSGRLWEVKNKRKFQTFSSKSGHSHLQEAVPYKRFQI